MNDRDLARLLIVVAGSIERESQVRSAGVLRQAARRLLELEPAVVESVCERCGIPVIQPHTGRPRRFCSDSCRRRRDPARTKVSETVS